MFYRNYHIQNVLRKVEWFSISNKWIHFKIISHAHTFLNSYSYFLQLQGVCTHVCLFTIVKIIYMIVPLHMRTTFSTMTDWYNWFQKFCSFINSYSQNFCRVLSSFNFKVSPKFNFYIHIFEICIGNLEYYRRSYFIIWKF